MLRHIYWLWCVTFNIIRALTSRISPQVKAPLGRFCRFILEQSNPTTTAEALDLLHVAWRHPVSMNKMVIAKAEQSWTKSNYVQLFLTKWIVVTLEPRCRDRGRVWKRCALIHDRAYFHLQLWIIQAYPRKNVPLSYAFVKQCKLNIRLNIII